MSLPPLYVDLDGTLVATDLLHESSLQLVRTAPGALLRWPGWLLRGKAYFKQRVAERVRLDPALLPYRPQMLETIRRAREQGRRVVLATASDHALAHSVARHLGLFDEVLASDGTCNLAGPRKLEAIRADSGGQPFSYAGDGAVDLPIWRSARSGIVVSNSQSLRRRVREATQIESEVDVPRAGLRDLLYGIRLHQWLKNLLVFVPLLPMLDAITAPMVLSTVALFFAFGLCASSIYVVNDLLDLEADRQHHRKKRRPIASGKLPIRHAVVLAAVLMSASVALAWWTLPPLAIATLMGYVVLTTAYSLWLKRRMLVDVFALAGLYTVRILAGMAAAQVETSFWLLGFSMFMFLSLALVKRYVEIGEMKGSGTQLVKGRAYVAADSVFVLAAGLTSGQLSILTLSLYLNDPQVMRRYDHPFALWLLCPLLLYWLVRIWLKGHRAELHDDPVVFAATDRISQLVLVLSVALVYAAL